MVHVHFSALFVEKRVCEAVFNSTEFNSQVSSVLILIAMDPDSEIHSEPVTNYQNSSQHQSLIAAAARFSVTEMSASPHQSSHRYSVIPGGAGGGGGDDDESQLPRPISSKRAPLSFSHPKAMALPVSQMPMPELTEDGDGAGKFAGGMLVDGTPSHVVDPTVAEYWTRFGCGGVFMTTWKL